ncbi:MAG TPA: hypothetical protein VGL83_15590 [Stellaceae bacterium]|jgi:hypothetical protein
MAETVPDPALLARLAALEPRNELILRLALRERHDTIRADRAANDRIKALLEALDPRPGEMAAILAAARAAEDGVEERLAGAPPRTMPTKRRRGDRKTRI